MERGPGGTSLENSTLGLLPTEGRYLIRLDAGLEGPFGINVGDIDNNGVDDFDDTRLSQRLTLDRQPGAGHPEL